MTSKSKDGSLVWKFFDYLRTEDVTDQTITASMYDMHVTNQIFYCFHIIQVDAFGKKKHRINIERIRKENSSRSDADVQSQSGTWTINSKSKTPSTCAGVTGQLRLHASFTMNSKVTRTSTSNTSITRALGVFIANFSSWKAFALCNLFTNLKKTNF